jgi:hypothetical protein
MVMEDLKARGFDPKEKFTTHLGKYMLLEEYAELLKNPFKPPAGFEDLLKKKEASSSVALPAPDEDRELTPEEIEELERQEKRETFYFADPDLSEEMKRPEKIYDYLYGLLPKCPKCGSVGLYKPPPKNKDKGQDSSGQDDKNDQAQSKSKGKGKGKKNDQHDHGDGNSCGCPDGQSGDQPGEGQGCCDGGLDIFGLGGTVDDHMDTSESEEKLAKRIADAMTVAQKMAGHVPSALEDELGLLTAPKVSAKDFIRTRLLKARAGNGRNDWTRFRTRPMFSGLLVPKRRNYYAHFGCLLDTSGSMSPDDMAFGLSQLAALDERSEGTVVPADAEIYWEQATKLKKANFEELSKVKVVGRGGTKYAEFFDDYLDKIGECDFLIVITDGYLLDTDVAEMKNPGKDVIWLLTANSSFNAPFGRVFDLHSM